MTITELRTNIQENIESIDEAKVQDYERKQKEREKQFNSMAPKTIEEQIVEELNQKHAVVHTDQFYILTEKPHSLFAGKDFTLESKGSFLNTYENQIVLCSDGKTLKSKAKIWLASKDRRQYQGITFDPTTKEHKGNLYNIWKGFAIEPIKGSCELYKNHIKNVICAGNLDYFNYVWKWLARLIQRPDEIATGLILMGKQGTGKNTFVEPLGKLFGSHYLPLDNIQQLLGQFNFHLKNAVLIHANEAIWGGIKKDIGVLKAMITDQFSVIEGKGKDRIVVRNFKHVIISSNEDWPVHLDRDDRRFLVLQISDKHKEDIPYFKAINKELENGGLENLLHELIKEDITDFNPRILPQNADAFSVKLMSASSAEKYIYEALSHGCFDLGNSTPNQSWNSSISCESVYKDYKIWCEQQGLKSEVSQRFGNTLYKLIPSITKGRPKSDGIRQYRYELPLLEKAREEFQQSFKAGKSIWD